MFGNDKIREHSLNKAIELYEDLLKIYTKQKFPEKNAEIQKKLGIAYYHILRIRVISEHENKAILALNEAIEYYKPVDLQKYAEVINYKGLILNRVAKKNKKGILESIQYLKICDTIYKNNNPYLYAKNLINLARANHRLFEINKDENYSNTSLEYAKGALNILEKSDLNNQNIRFDLAECHDVLGVSFRKMSDLNDRKKKLENAIYHYLQALRIYKSHRDLKYSDTCHNISISYSRLSQFCSTKENIGKAIDYSNESIIIRNENDYPISYAKSMHSQGDTFVRLAKFRNFRENINQSIICYNKSSQIRKKEGLKFPFAEIQIEAAFSYIKLSKIEGKANNLKLAEDALNVAFEILKDSENYNALSDCLRCYDYLYYEISKIIDKKEYLEKAFEYEKRSINLEKADQYRYAMNQFQIGRIYCELSSVEYPIVNLGRSNEALDNAMSIFSKEGCPYYISKTNFYKGIAFYHMSNHHLENQEELLKKSLDQYTKALETINRGEYILFCAKVKFHMANSYAKFDDDSAKEKSQELYKEVLDILKKENVEEGYQIVQEKISCQ